MTIRTEQRLGRGVRSATTAAMCLICLLLAACNAGCVNRGLSPSPQPAIGSAISIQALAGHLGMRIGRASRYSVSMTSPANALLIMGPPRPGVILNGRRIGNGHGVAERRGQLVVERGLATEIRRQLQRPPASPQAVQPTLPAHAATGAIVALDAGHGGKDPGAPNRYGPTESLLAMDVVHRVAGLLHQRGVRVVLTRSDDRFIELNERAAIANRVGADLLVSLHADSHPSASIDGFTVYVARKPRKQTKALADATARSLKRRVPTFRGVRKQDFRVLVRTDMPAVLIEMGYLTNPAEAAKLSTEHYRQELAEAIADGIVSYLNSRR